jgi:hypothetical protein
MKHKPLLPITLWGTAAAILAMAVTTIAMATEPCDDFGECKVLVEINSSDGDIGFHFLMDGDDLNSAMIHDPNGQLVFEDSASGPLLDQKLTETFAESAEPLCFDPTTDDDEENDDEDFVTLDEFLERWTPGTYMFTGLGDDDEMSEGETELKFELPAAPQDLMYDDGVISWSPGDDLGECATNTELAALVPGTLPVHPEDVEVDAWEVVFEPEAEDGDILGSMKYTVRVPGDIALLAVTVPEDYLAALPDDTLVKIEVGAIGAEDNATFSELSDVCVNETDEGGLLSVSAYYFQGLESDEDEGCGEEDE